MARISLRAYDQEIEGLIDTHQFDQAIAHCQHILRYYPKHIDTYRLMGKAFLENQRYGDAADIFQRVLSSVPDDFVSHVGMSIIREDEGNLDEAIWHMERAFDVQPANNAIQRELSRLYGRRDGLEPPKVRLTRGALARMYIKGDLYPQAISEIRIALKDAPQRHDLLVLLAQAHFRLGQRFEAAELCSKLLIALPHCLEANYILGEVLANSERAAEAKTFQMRAQALNPYLAHVTPNAPTADKVPDSAVVVEKMIWSPGKAPQQPAWAASLGVELEESAAKPEALPDWLAETEARPEQEESLSPPASPPEMEQEAAPPSPEGSLPAWMQEAGWMPASGLAEETDIPFAQEEAEGDQLAPGEMPEWLRSITPQADRAEPEFLAAQPAAPEAETPEPRSTGSLPWIEDEPASESDTVASWLEDKEVPVTSELSLEPAAESVELPEWLRGMVDEPEPVGEEPTPPAEELPSQPQQVSAAEDSLLEEASLAEAPPGAALEPADMDGDQALAWLEGLAEKQGVSDGLLLTPEERREALPDWVQEMPEASEQAEPAAAEQLPDWLAGIQASAPVETPSKEVKPEAQPAEEIPAWLSMPLAGEGDVVESLPSLEADTQEIQAAPVSGEWRLEEELELPVGEPAPEPDLTLPEALAPEVPAAVQEMPVADEAQAAQLPDWLQDLEAEQPAEVLPGFGMLFSPTESQKLAETLQGEAPLTLEETQPIEGDTAPVAVHPVESAPPMAEIESFEAGEGIPDWLAALEAEAETPGLVAADTEQAVSELTPEASAEAMDEEAAFAWLEGLAARQGADEALLLQPEDRIEEAPSWVVQAMEDEAASAPAEGQAEEIPAVLDVEPEVEAIPAFLETPQEAEDLPAFLRTTPETEAIPAFGEIAPEAEEIPAFLKGRAEAEDLFAAPQAAPEAEAVPAEATEEAFALIEPAPAAEQPPAAMTPAAAEIAAAEQAEMVEAEAALPELPTWLAGVEQETTIEAETAWQPPAEIPVQELAIPGEGIATEAPRLDINEAGLVDLERLPGIGFIKAQAIFEYRLQHGDFTQVDDLLKVPGMGPAILDQLRPLITVWAPSEVEALEPLSEDQITLVQARNALVSGEIAQTVGSYQHLIQAEKMLPDVINDLNEALYRFPVEISLWESLGDAYFRVDRLQDALDAYTKAEELLR